VSQKDEIRTIIIFHASPPIQEGGIKGQLRAFLVITVMPTCCARSDGWLSWRQRVQVL